MNEAAAIIYDMVDPEANLIFGAVIDPSLSDEVSITIIATGFGTAEPELGALAAARGAAGAGAGTAVGKPGAAVSGAVSTVGDDGRGGIEIPDFLRRRRMQGK